MNDQRVKTDNEVIAEFMGEKMTPEDEAMEYTLDKRPYNDAWPWIMSVIQKIYSLDNDLLYEFIDDTKTAIPSIFASITEVNAFAVKFVHWYNENINPHEYRP